MYEDIGPLEYLERKAADADWRLLDVREEWEREIASVDGSINIPMAQIPDRLGELDTSRPIAVLCHSGVRSARVASFLAGQGFQTVANIAGGIDAWSTDIDSDLQRY